MSVTKPTNSDRVLSCIISTSNVARLPHMQFDFGSKVSIQPTAYTIRHDGADFQLYNWQLEGSTDAHAWTTIRCHVEDESFPARKGIMHGIHTWHELNQHGLTL